MLASGGTAAGCRIGAKGEVSYDEGGGSSGVQYSQRLTDGGPHGGRRGESLQSCSTWKQ